LKESLKVFLIALVIGWILLGIANILFELENVGYVFAWWFWVAVGVTLSYYAYNKNNKAFTVAFSVIFVVFVVSSLPFIGLWGLSELLRTVVFNTMFVASILTIGYDAFKSTR